MRVDRVYQKQIKLKTIAKTYFAGKLTSKSYVDLLLLRFLNPQQNPQTNHKYCSPRFAVYLGVGARSINKILI